MTDWLNRLAPDASEPLQLAARCQHIRRWEIPRDRYPRTRAGYHQWRTTLYRFHADQAERILRQVGYDQPAIDRVRSLVMKQSLKTDAEAQLLEDVICLVFLENYFAPFAAGHSDEKIIGILKKTWMKMSPRGRSAALQLPLQDRDRQLIQKAIAAASAPPGDQEAPSAGENSPP